MFEKILQQLKTKYKDLGLSETILKAKAKQIEKAVKAEDEIENAVAGVEDDLAIFQSFADQNRTLAKKIEDLEKGKTTDPKPADPADPKPEDPKPAPTGGLDESVLQLLKELKGELTTLKAEKSQQTNAQKMQSKLDELKVSKSYLDILPQSPTERTFQSDEEIEAFATSLKAKSDAYEQSVANGSLGAVAKPLFGEVAKEGGVSTDVQAFIKTNYNNETNTAV